MATNYREILRLKKMGYSQRSIAASVGCARSTVQRVFERLDDCQNSLDELLKRKRQLYRHKKSPKPPESGSGPNFYQTPCITSSYFS